MVQRLEDRKRLVEVLVRQLDTAVEVLVHHLEVHRLEDRRLDTAEVLDRHLEVHRLEDHRLDTVEVLDRPLDPVHRQVVADMADHQPGMARGATPWIWKQPMAEAVLRREADRAAAHPRAMQCEHTAQA